jgi:hypothetical protein
MAELEERKTAVEVPAGTTIEGLLALVTSVLRKPRVRQVQIGMGKLEYTRRAHSGEPEEALDIPLENYRLSELIRKVELESRPMWPDVNKPLEALCDLYFAGQRRGLVPLCLVMHPETRFYPWLRHAGILAPPERDYFHGSPVILDGGIPEDDVYLLSGFTSEQAPQSASLVLKLSIPEF